MTTKLSFSAVFLLKFHSECVGIHSVLITKSVGYGKLTECGVFQMEAEDLDHNRISDPDLPESTDANARQLFLRTVLS